MNPSPAIPSEVDWLVLGGGIGGLSAALSGALHGMSVYLVEKGTQLGGTAATSAGTIWIPGNRQNIRAGFEGDSIDAAREYLESLIDYPESGREAREAFLTNGPDALDWYEQTAGLRFIACGPYPDYLDRPGAAGIGRALIPEPFDARVLGDAFKRVRAPIPEFMIFGGMMIAKADIAPLLGRFQSFKNFRYAASLFARYLMDRLSFPRGTRLTLGNALIGQMYHKLVEHRVPISFESRLIELEFDQRRVTGARISGLEGERFVRARRGVVLATGGIGRDRELRQRFLGNEWPDSLTVPENTGDGLRAGISLGALTLPTQHGTGAFWAPVSRTGSGRWAGLYPHLAMDRAKPGIIAVNKHGKRFVNEADSYHHFTLAMFETHAGGPREPVWLVCNHDFVRRYGLGAIHPGTRNLELFAAKRWIIVANDLSELASKAKIDPAGLQEAVARVDSLADSGVDEDFGKGSTRLNRYNGDPLHKPNPCFGAVGSGPYCAVPLWPAELGTSIGLETDGSARVLDARGIPVEGLYACGSDQASVMRGTYPGPGTTLGPAMVFGWMAARHAAG